jgi:DtxR family Mn-dependent transcriptional regulator
MEDKHPAGIFLFTEMTLRGKIILFRYRKETQHAGAAGKWYAGQVGFVPPETFAFPYESIFWYGSEHELKRPVMPEFGDEREPPALLWNICSPQNREWRRKLVKIHKSAEDYLEAVLKLGEKKKGVRSIDIVNETGFSKPSISVAMKHLRENGYITMDSDGHITLTESGRAIASRIYGRHKTLAKMLMELGVAPQAAEEDACRVEHDLSEESYEKIREYAEKHLG